MTHYVKVNPRVARILGVKDVRYRYADGYYQLWEKDMRDIDPDWAFDREGVLRRIGAVLFDPYQNKEEQGRPASECTPLPEAEDPEFRWNPETDDADMAADDAADDAADGTDGVSDAAEVSDADADEIVPGEGDEP